MKKETVFQVKAYSWQELALLYSPGLAPLAARKRLRRWINHHPTLATELRALGWRKGLQILSPSQVQLIVNILGEP